MDAALALVTIAVMLTLGCVAFALLTRLLTTIRELRGVTTGLNDTLRWAVGEAAPRRGRGHEEARASS